MEQPSNFKVYSASAGSGKTFTLVKEYLKILISSKNPYVFQQILAITFTNKAAGEMKERVLMNLHLFASQEANDMLELLEKETEIERARIFSRAEKALDAILQNYASFNITTIDSFTHKLIRTFAYDLQLPMNFEVEMDGKEMLSEAVDMVISKIGTDKKRTELLVNYALEKIEDDKSWDISQELKEFAGILLDENHGDKLQVMSRYSIEDFQKLGHQLRTANLQIAEKFIAIGNEGLGLIDDRGIVYNSFSYSDLPNHFKKLQEIQSLNVLGLKFEGRLFDVVEQEKPFYKAAAPEETKQVIEEITPYCRELYYQSKEVYDNYFGQFVLNKYILEGLIPLAVLNYVNGALNSYKQENNILLNAEFNTLISNKIKDEPAPFIYERIGEKFRYYFIDEMQDTSQMQWQNLIPLIANALSSLDEQGNMGSLMLVGDGKQSIYRWRGGKAEQFIALASEASSEDANPFYAAKTVYNLPTNFRSFSEVINFNNQFFQHLSNYFGNDDFKKMYLEGNAQECSSKTGGYVEISFVDQIKDKEERELIFGQKVLDLIYSLDGTFNRSEICVLVRTRSQGVAIANYLAEHKVDIFSSETLLLKNSKIVLFIMDVLRVIENPNDKEAKAHMCYFLWKHFEAQTEIHDFLEQRVHLSNQAFFESFEHIGSAFKLAEFYKMFLTQGIEYVIRSFHLLKKSDSNVQFFLDAVFDYQQKHEASIASFLEYWELKKDSLSIVAPEAENAVRIMTIHKAKGLEFPVVIFPFDLDIYKQIKPKIWFKTDQFSEQQDYFLINFSEGIQKIGNQGEHLYKTRRHELELDNFNLLYVALTRAVEQLYLIVEPPSSKPEDGLKKTSDFYKSYLVEKGVWNEQEQVFAFGTRARSSKETTHIVRTQAQQKFISSSWDEHQIHIVANASLLWDTSREESIQYGNLIHAILSEIKTAGQIEKVVSKYIRTGNLSSSEGKIVIEMLRKIVTHSKLETYFAEGIEVYCEREIMTNQKEIIIPDRLNFIGDSVVIIDYKTGQKDEKYIGQVNYYAKTLGELGYKVIKKNLVYIGDEIFVDEV